MKTFKGGMPREEKKWNLAWIQSALLDLVVAKWNISGKFKVRKLSQSSAGGCSDDLRRMVSDPSKENTFLMAVNIVPRKREDKLKHKHYYS